MAFAKVYLKNSRTGQMREAPVGFSWTTFFFGFFPALFRSDWVGAIIQLLLGCVTFGLSNLVFMFVYNKMYLKRLLNEGYEATSGSADLSFVEQRVGLLLPRVS